MELGSPSAAGCGPGAISSVAGGRVAKGVAVVAVVVIGLLALLRQSAPARGRAKEEEGQRAWDETSDGGRW